MLTVRLATTPADVEAAQRLRFSVFHEELGARHGAAARLRRRDEDRFDAHCDHLLVESHAPDGDAAAVGTYRLLRQHRARNIGGFYSQGEFDIAPLLCAHAPLEFVELGRSCVRKDYRSRPVIELLWQGIWTYVRTRRIGAMIGCASLPGTDIARLAEPLSYLAHNFRAAPDWRVRALPERFIDMNRLPRAAYKQRNAMRQLPPLIRAYLRAGARIGDGAVIDRQFNTTDVLMILPVAQIAPRYIDRFTPARGRRDDAVQPLMS